MDVTKKSDEHISSEKSLNSSSIFVKLVRGQHDLDTLQIHYNRKKNVLCLVILYYIWLFLSLVSPAAKPWIYANWIRIWAQVYFCTVIDIGQTESYIQENPTISTAILNCGSHFSFGHLSIKPASFCGH